MWETMPLCAAKNTSDWNALMAAKEGTEIAVSKMHKLATYSRVVWYIHALKSYFHQQIEKNALQKQQ